MASATRKFAAELIRSRCKTGGSREEHSECGESPGWGVGWGGGQDTHAGGRKSPAAPCPATKSPRRVLSQAEQRRRGEGRPFLFLLGVPSPRFPHGACTGVRMRQVCTGLCGGQHWGWPRSPMGRPVWTPLPRPQSPAASQHRLLGATAALPEREGPCSPACVEIPSLLHSCDPQSPRAHCPAQGSGPTLCYGSLVSSGCFLCRTPRNLRGFPESSHSLPSGPAVWDSLVCNEDIRGPGQLVGDAQRHRTSTGPALPPKGRS